MRMSDKYSRVHAVDLTTQLVVDALRDRQPVKIHQCRRHVIIWLQIIFQASGCMKNALQRREYCSRKVRQNTVAIVKPREHERGHELNRDVSPQKLAN